MHILYGLRAAQVQHYILFSLSWSTHLDSAASSSRARRASRATASSRSLATADTEAASTGADATRRSSASRRTISWSTVASASPFAAMHALRSFSTAARCERDARGWIALHGMDRHHACELVESHEWMTLEARRSGETGAMFRRGRTRSSVKRDAMLAHTHTHTHTHEQYVASWL
jgi:hypothetical protein